MDPQRTRAAALEATMLQRMDDMPAGTIGFEAIGEVEDDDWEREVEPLLRSEIAEGRKVRLLYLLGPESREVEGDVRQTRRIPWSPNTPDAAASASSARSSSPTRSRSASDTKERGDSSDRVEPRSRVLGNEGHRIIGQHSRANPVITGHSHYHA